MSKLTCVFSIILVCISAAGVTAVLAGCASSRTNPEKDPVLLPLWRLWRAGDFEKAEAESTALINDPETRNEGNFMRVLLSHIQGRYDTAITAFSEIDDGFRHVRFLHETVLWSYIHSNRHEEAYDFANSHSMGTVAKKRIKSAIDNPMSVHIDSTEISPFFDDALTPNMPGFEITVNGHPQIARLDTGGSYIHVTKNIAEKLGIMSSDICEKSFAALTVAELCYTTADLTIGGISMKNVPVAIHASGIQTEALSQAYGVEVGPIIGTNILKQFLTTVDPRHKRIIFSPLNDPVEREHHFSLLEGSRKTVPFSMLHSHFLLAGGSVAGKNCLFFVDSGLVVANSHQGQVSFLAGQKQVASWNTSPAPQDSFPEIPGSAGLSGLEMPKQLAYPVPDTMWKQFGSWSGLNVEALLSWGYLKHFTWTIDFERREFIFHQ